ncbi:MAG: hypothetical protein ACYCQJ_15725 [Nitrososphaerales archaeon]
MADSVTVDSSSLVLAILLKDGRPMQSLERVFRDHDVSFVKAQVVFTFDRNREAYKESDQTLFVMTQENLDKAIAAGFNLHPYDFSIPKMKGPDPATQGRNLHFKGFPRGWTPTNVEDYLKDIVHLFVPASQVTIRVKQNEDGEVLGYGDIIFKRDTPDIAIKSIMAILLNHPVDATHIVHCQWSQNKSRAGKAFNTIYLKQR